MQWASDVWKSIKLKKNHRFLPAHGAKNQLEKDNSQAIDIDINHTGKETVINNFNSATVV